MSDAASSAVSAGAQQSLADIRRAQNFGLAMAAGLGAAIAGAILWAVITVVSQMELGIVAVAIGYIVGQAIKAAGKGIDQRFGILGAACALLGCGLGNVLSAVAFFARAKAIAPDALLSVLNVDLVQRLAVAFFQPMDLLFYGIAVYEGYRLSFKYRMRKPA